MENISALASVEYWNHGFQARSICYYTSCHRVSQVKCVRSWNGNFCFEIFIRKLFYTNRGRDLLWAPEEVSSIISSFFSFVLKDQYLAIILSILTGHLSESFNLCSLLRTFLACQCSSSFLFFRRNSTQLIEDSKLKSFTLYTCI